ncbi:MAG: hypothetical protein M3R13_08600 [Armatimonadota bacterium]|nr:hypothetical protein [Armatimonadota bacterium]
MNAILAGLAVFGPPAQVIDYGNHLINPSHAGAYTPIGWSNDEQWWARDTELNGGGAMSRAERVVASVLDSRIKAYWYWDENDPATQLTWLDSVSADTFTSLGIAGGTTGHLIYQFPVSFFQSNQKLKPFSQLKMQYTFTLQGVNHTVSLSQEWEPNWTTVSPPDPGPVRYRRAKVSVSVDGEHIGEAHFDDTFGYSIDRIYLSPGRDTIAVSLARFTVVWFEGVNLVAERRALVARYR